MQALESIDVEVLRGASVLEARGRSRRGQRGARAHPARTTAGVVACDLLVVSGGSAPATSLIAQAGGKTSYDDARGHFALSVVPDGVLVAARSPGTACSRPPSAPAPIAGAEAAHELGFGDADSRARVESERERLAARGRSAGGRSPCRRP